MKRDAFIREMDLNIGFKRLGLSIAPGLPLSGHRLRPARSGRGQPARRAGGRRSAGTAFRSRAVAVGPMRASSIWSATGRDVAYANVLARQAGQYVARHGGLGRGRGAVGTACRTSCPPNGRSACATRFSSPRPNMSCGGCANSWAFATTSRCCRMRARCRARCWGRWRKTDAGELAAAEHRAARWLLQNGYFLSATVRAAVDHPACRAQPPEQAGAGQSPARTAWHRRLDQGRLYEALRRQEGQGAPEAPAERNSGARPGLTLEPLIPIRAERFHRSGVGRLRDTDERGGAAVGP